MCRLFCAMLVALIIAPGIGCKSPDSESVAAVTSTNSAVDSAVSISEQRTDTLSDLIREMRDTDSNFAFPLPDAFWAEVRRRHPAADSSSDMTLDGWQRPLFYVRGGDMRTFRLYSAGPNGKDEYGVGDDVALRQGETSIE